MIGSRFLTTAAVVGAFLVTVSNAKVQFSGDFLVSNLVVDAPFQAQPNSTASSFVWLDISDQDTLAIAPTRCILQWPVGITPENGTSACANNSFTAEIPDAAYFGIQNFTINLAHRYIDNSIGDAPYNVLTKSGGLNLTFPGTEDYECNFSRGYCGSIGEASLLAVVTRAIS